MEGLYGVQMMKKIDHQGRNAVSRCKSDLRSGTRRPGGRKWMLAGLLAAGTVAMTGCASYNQDQMTVGSVPDDYRLRHPIIVSENETARDIVIPRNLKQLSLRDRDIVKGIGSDFRRSGAKSIMILIPSGSPNEHAARQAASQAVAELKQAGVGAHQISISHYSAAQHGESATLRIAYSDLAAGIASQCGQWNEDITATSANRNYYNFGCATQNNLAQMVANPADLLGPRAMSEVDSTKRTGVIEDWRDSSTKLVSDLGG